MVNLVFYPYYAHLNTEKRKFYDQLLTGFKAYKKRIEITVPAKFQNVSEVVNAITYDHPELFWISGGKTHFNYNSQSGQVNYVEPDYNYPISNIPKMQRELNSAVQRYLSSITDKKLLAKERIIHDKMVNEITYVHGANDQNAYGALVEKKAVCAGYTRAFQLLMQEIGIPCYYCIGNAIGDGKAKWDSHAWNILKLGKDYYNMDLTWDDCYDKTDPGRISYKYYNCDDRQINSNHRRSPECKCLPACSGNQYTFDKVFGRSPKLEEIYQNGVTCRQVIRSKTDFDRDILPSIRRNAGKTTKVAFPVEYRGNFDTFRKTLDDSLHNAVKGRSCQWTTSGLNYGDGWHWVQIKIEYRVT